MNYIVFRYYRKIFTGNFSELKAWMLNNPAFKDYKDRIESSTEECFDTQVWEDSDKDLGWIAVCTEYCSIKQVKD